MDIKEKILKLLKESGYEINDNINIRVDQFIDCLRDENIFHDLETVKRWLEKQKEKCGMEVKEININDLKDWYVDKNTGNIYRKDREFFSIIGIRIKAAANREVTGWDQPIISQKEMGILGILCKRFNGIRHYLLNAKAEPGNIHKLQLSPTLQSTFSNLKMAHHGKRPKFAEFFESPKPKTVKYSKWLAEDGGRLYLKTNLNILVEVDENTELNIPDDYIWLTMYQIKQLLQHDCLINPHVRSIICHL